MSYNISQCVYLLRTRAIKKVYILKTDKQADKFLAQILEVK